MEKSLIIVESPAKAKTINKYLGKEYVVHASVGHIKNLPKSKLGVEIEDGFRPTFHVIEGKQEVLESLRSSAKQSKNVYIATDPDREGEAIAADIAEEIEEVNKNIYRVLFHEITKKGITEAMDSPGKIDANLVASQRARRVMDRIVGYKISPIVWKTFFYGLSAGRVQSVALRLICERETEIQSFTPQAYWSIVGEFEVHDARRFFAKLVRIGDRDLIVPSRDNLAEAERRGDIARYTFMGTEEAMQEHLRAIPTHSYAIDNVQKRESRRNPPAPFITSTLQQEASQKLRFSSKRTMTLAQKLYEGIDLGEEGLVGLISYMRTDSTRLGDDIVTDARAYILNAYGKEYVPRHPIVYKKKASQDAHEAIRPTSLKYTPAFVRKHLDKELFKLYELIWNRFIACQMEAAVLESTTVTVCGGPYTFKATSSRYLFRGFLQLYDDAVEEEQEQREEEDPEVVDEQFPEMLAAGQHAKVVDVRSHSHETKPPPRYTEGSLVKVLEALGIGRPSTYAMIVGTIIDRKYVEQRERKLYALPLGMEVNAMLVTNFPDVLNVKFTAKMEKELDTIAAGKYTYEKVMNDFYHPFSHSLERVAKHTASIKKSLQQQTGEVCELCGRPMISKWGRNGRFMACSGYPDCKNTKPMPEDQEKLQHLSGLKCELCGGDMLVRSSRFGTFLGCSNYPTCKNTKPISMGIKCPKCGTGDLIERKTKRKRTFYGCSRYPECDFASWDKPVSQACDTCGSPYMVLKYNQKRGEYLKCPACQAEVAREEVAATG